MRRLFALSKAAIAAAIALVIALIAVPAAMAATSPLAASGVTTIVVPASTGSVKAALATYDCYQGVPTMGTITDNKTTAPVVVTLSDGGVKINGPTVDPNIYAGVDVRLSTNHTVGSTVTVIMYVGGVQVDTTTYTVAAGCGVTPPVDSDKDGVPDSSDKCPATPAGATVDANGCSASQRDTDGDGVKDDVDKCAGTPAGTTVGADGCPVTTATPVVTPAPAPKPVVKPVAPKPPVVKAKTTTTTSRAVGAETGIDDTTPQGVPVGPVAGVLLALFAIGAAKRRATSKV